MYFATGRLQDESTVSARVCVLAWPGSHCARVIDAQDYWQIGTVEGLFSGNGREGMERLIARQSELRCRQLLGDSAAGSSPQQQQQHDPLSWDSWREVGSAAPQPG